MPQIDFEDRWNKRLREISQLIKPQGQIFLHGVGFESQSKFHQVGKIDGIP